MAEFCRTRKPLIININISLKPSRDNKKVGTIRDLANQPDSKEQLGFIHGLSLKTGICANTPTTKDDIKSLIAVLNKTGELPKKAGLEFACHKFKKEEGKIRIICFCLKQIRML